MKIDNEKNV